MPMSKKFWEIINKADNTAEIRIYGDIVGRKAWYDIGPSVDPVGFADDLAKLENRPVTIRVNSNGGNVFAAQTIANNLRTYKGMTTAIVDGLAASAATIIVMAARKIIMPIGSMMMIHDPMVQINEAMNEEELQRCIDMLRPVKTSLVKSYLERSNLSKDKLAAMMKATTWLTAEECLDIGFADEIQGEVKPVMNGNVLIVNNLKRQLTDNEASEIKNKITKHVNVQGKNQKEDFSMHDDIKKMLIGACAAFGIKVGDGAQATPAANVAAPQTAAPSNVLATQVVNQGVTASDPVQVAVAAERKRIKELEEADQPNNAVVHRIINQAKENGQHLSDIQAVLDIIKDEQKGEPGGQQFMQKLVADQIQSGSNQVGANPGGNMTEEQCDAAAADYMVNLLQNKYKGGRA